MERQDRHSLFKNMVTQNQAFMQNLIQQTNQQTIKSS
jgi:hypothetical protein